MRCTECREPAEPNRKKCDYHLRKAREYSRKHYNKLNQGRTRRPYRRRTP